MSKDLESKKRGKKTLKKIKTFFGIGLKTRDIKCPFCKEVFEGPREWGLHIKEEHCR